MNAFPNEIFIDKDDKEELVGLLYRANEILNKYPSANHQIDTHTVTNMMRAKSYTKDALVWSNFLCVKE